MSSSIVEGCLLCTAERVTPWHFEDEECWVADCLVCSTPMIVWRVHGLPEPELERERLFCLGSLLLGLAGSMVAASRGGFIGLVVGTAFLVWRSRHRGQMLMASGGALLLFLALSPSSPLPPSVEIPPFLYLT